MTIESYKSQLANDLALPDTWEKERYLRALSIRIKRAA